MSMGNPVHSYIGRVILWHYCGSQLTINTENVLILRFQLEFLVLSFLIETETDGSVEVI